MWKSDPSKVKGQKTNNTMIPLSVRCHWCCVGFISVVYTPLYPVAALLFIARCLCFFKCYRCQILISGTVWCERDDLARHANTSVSFRSQGRFNEELRGGTTRGISNVKTERVYVWKPKGWRTDGWVSMGFSECSLHFGVCSHLSGMKFDSLILDFLIGHISMIPSDHWRNKMVPVIL